MFSVVIPLYNKQYSIEKCINSVLNQKFKNFELIIVNDGSSDNSLEIAKKTCNNNRDIEIKFINQENQGVSIARNNGVNHSKFDYICFLDADDEWTSDFLLDMNNLIQRYEEANLYCLAHLIKKGNKIIKPKHGLDDDFEGYVSDFFYSSSRGSVAKSSKICVRKPALLNIGGFPEKIVAGEDLYVWILLALNGKVAASMKFNTIVYQEVDDSRHSRKNSVPYPLVYFSLNKSVIRPTSLNKYLFLIFIKHFIFSLKTYNFKEAYLRLKYFLRIFL
ncbi:glycosyltransferase family 2 protein [Acinetobacter indicus]|uniref:glycosyltransferase family 2 protein n=1 Tax=Acinetobacter indicus TaxID=756892 RepID=UPI00143FBD95|nr:glycosyltransferase family A protein [Acinetobacter indicus]QIZ60560.1 glycosyltransferase family 2 protein [Acinetobacter indicus]